MTDKEIIEALHKIRGRMNKKSIVINSTERMILVNDLLDLAEQCSNASQQVKGFLEATAVELRSRIHLIERIEP